MIQRSRKPVKTEVVLGSKLVNENNINTKPKKKKPINEFVGGSKLVNENNIVINMPVPIVKKKRKRKPKMQTEPEGISDEAKRNFQETSSQYARGTYPPIPDSVDISKIKTTAALNAFTNTLRTVMGLPPVVPITSTTSPTVPVVPVRPVLTETTTAVASIPAVATTSDLSPPIASGVPTLSPPTLNAPVRPILPQAPVIIDEKYIYFDKLFIYFLDILKKISNKEDTTEIDDTTLLYYKRNDEILNNIEKNKFYKYLRTFLDKLNIPNEIKKFIYNTSYPKLYFKFRELSIREKDLSDDVNVKEDEKKRVDSTKNITKKDIEKEEKILEEQKNKLKEEN